MSHWVFVIRRFGHVGCLKPLPDDIAQSNDNARLRYFRLPDTDALFVT